MISILKSWFWIATAALGVSSCICILPLTMPASANAADPCAPLGFQTGNGNRCIFPVAAGDVRGPNGLVAAIRAAKRANSSFLSSDIVLAPGIYTVMGVASNQDGPTGLLVSPG